MKGWIRKSLAFLIIWFLSGSCFNLHQQGFHLQANLIALISLSSFILLNEKEIKSKKGE